MRGIGLRGVTFKSGLRWIVVVCGCCDVWLLGDNDVFCDIICDEVGIVVGNDVELLNCIVRKKILLIILINIYLVYLVYCYILCLFYRWNFYFNFVFLNFCYILLEKVFNIYLDNKKFFFYFVYFLIIVDIIEKYIKFISRLFNFFCYDCFFYCIFKLL